MLLIHVKPLSFYFFPFISPTIFNHGYPLNLYLLYVLLMFASLYLFPKTCVVVVVLCVFDLHKWYSALNLICFWCFSLSTVFFNFNCTVTRALSLLLLTAAFQYVRVDKSVTSNNV